MFHYCAGIFIISFLRGLNFSPHLFPLSLRSFTFSLLRVPLGVQLEALCFLHGNFMTFQQGAGTEDSGWWDGTDMKTLKELLTVLFVS